MHGLGLVRRRLEGAVSRRASQAARALAESPEAAGLSEEEFMDRWRRRLAHYQELPATVDGARLARLVLEEFEAVLRRRAGELLTLQEAAEESGVTSGHLGRLVRERKIPNAGQKHRPRVRRGDLPPADHRRPAGRKTAAYDPVLDARSLFGGRRA